MNLLPNVTTFFITLQVSYSRRDFIEKPVTNGNTVTKLEKFLTRTMNLPPPFVVLYGKSRDEDNIWKNLNK